MVNGLFNNFEDEQLKEKLREQRKMMIMKVKLEIENSENAFEKFDKF